MKISAWRFGFAGAVTVFTIYGILACLLKYWPTESLKFIGTIHMLPKLSLIKSFIKVTPQAIVMGIITHTLIGFFIFWLLATLYNLPDYLFKK